MLTYVCTGCCKQFPQKLTQCSACKNAFYCSRECQVTDWPRHQARCREVEKRLEDGSRNILITPQKDRAVVLQEHRMALDNVRERIRRASASVKSKARAMKYLDMAMESLAGQFSKADAGGLVVGKDGQSYFSVEMGMPALNNVCKAYCAVGMHDYARGLKSEFDCIKP